MVICMGFRYTLFCFDNVKVAILLRALISHSEKKNNVKLGKFIELKKSESKDPTLNIIIDGKTNVPKKKMIDKKISLSAQEIFHYFR